ncbi:TIGR04255 family protein [Citrobacter bitternis]|uniref:TIGR04255 family protein n=1 Tax=Citrobacter bitternis TaxID=1585982 RepID=A0ABW1Q2W2_9ENTR
MTNKHLIYMLSKIQFGRIPNTIFLSVSDYILEALRKEYPVVLPKKNVQTFKIEFKGVGVPEMIQEEDPVLTLASANKDWAIRITPEHVILHTKNYDCFDDFEMRMKKIFSALQTTLNISHFSFIGMRFLNKFPHSVGLLNEFGINRSEFLQPIIDGYNRGGSNLSARYEDMEKRYFLSINSGVVINGPKITPELAELASDILNPVEVDAGVVAHFDIDSFYFLEDRMEEFNIDVISNKLNELRVASNAIFKNIVS